MKPIDIKILDSRIKKLMPSYATPGSAGIDLRSAQKEERVFLWPDETRLLPTGVAFKIPDEYVGLVFPRSGLGHKHGIVLSNLVGVIDSDFRGEVMLPMWNRSDKSFLIQPMDRIAQMVIVPYTQVWFNIVEEFDNSERGASGFGSTGLS